MAKITIDEAIELLRNNNTILEEDLQIIEWLNELKTLRKLTKIYETYLEQKGADRCGE